MTNVVPSGERAPAAAFSSWNLAFACPVVRSQTVIVLSGLGAARVLPSWEIAPDHYRNVELPGFYRPGNGRPDGPGNVPFSLPVATSQSFVGWSPPAISVWPSRENTTDLTAPPCLRVSGARAEPSSQSLTIPSTLPETKSLPSDEKPTEWTELRCGS